MMKEPSLTVANYTTILKDVDSETLTAIQSLLSTDSFCTQLDVSLYNVFMSIWRYYEISDSDEDVFIQMLTDVYNEHKNYYKEVVTNYIKAYDYSTNNKRVMSRIDSSTRTNSNTRTEDLSNTRTEDLSNTHVEDLSNSVTGSTANDKTEYDLPNKVVTPLTNDGYATGKTKDSGSNSSTSTGDNTVTDTGDNTVTNTGDNTITDEGETSVSYTSTITHTYNNEFLDLKKKYMEQIRNVYREFSEKFSDCFIHLFS